MKLTSKILLIVSIVLFGGFIFVVLPLQRVTRSVRLNMVSSNLFDEVLSGPDMETTRRIQRLFSQGHFKEINQLLAVRQGEVALRIYGADTFPTTHIMRLTDMSYNYKGCLQDDFSMDCSVSLSTRCHVLAPGQKLSIPALFPVTGAGRHKIILSGGFPIYKQESFLSSSSETQGMVTADYTFIYNKP